MKRRDFLHYTTGTVATASLLSVTETFAKINVRQSPEVIVVGAGVFGMWSAFYMQELGAKVTVIDAYGPANSRASSGGETRLLRADYGERLLYSKMNIESHGLWDSWQKEWGRQIMYPTGYLKMGDDDYSSSALAAQNRLKKLDIPSELLGYEELKYRWPQINFQGLTTGLYYPGGPGGSTLMAREALQLVNEKFQEKGGKFIIGKAKAGEVVNGKVSAIELEDGQKINADQVVFSCGPWMGKIFPELFGDRLDVTRRDVLFVGPKAGDNSYSDPQFPAWSFMNAEDSRYYGFPDLQGRGLKVAPYPDKNEIDMDSDDRLTNLYEIKRVRKFVNKRFPGLKDQPITETRVCQITNSFDSHFIVDTHPNADNFWFACAGSGHAFKHGPALGKYMAERIIQDKKVEEYDEAFRLKES